MNLDYRNIVSKLSLKGWLAVGGAAMVGVVFVVLLFNFASAPSYSTLIAGVTPSQAGKITDALSTSGIAYQLGNSGTAVSVKSAELSKARVVLDTQGLLSGTSSSSLESLLGKTSLGESDTQQQEQQTSALEEQLEQQLESMSDINSAQVSLAIPSETAELWASSSTSPSASVLLNTDGTLSSSTVRSIASLVADAVTGLKTSAVTITDQDGDALWPSSGSSSTNTKQAAEEAYDSWAAAKAMALLNATLGPDKAVVQVASDLNANKQTLQSLTYNGKTVPLSTTSTTETLTSADGTVSTGTTTVASYAGSTSSGPSKYKSSSKAATNGADKTISQETVAPGAINRQTIAVLVSSKVPRTDLPKIETAVKNALGFTTGRDQISISQVPFATIAAKATGGGLTNMVGYLKYILLGLAALLFLLFIARLLRRRERALIPGQPTWIREYQQPRPLANLQAERQAAEISNPPTEITELRPPVNVARQQIENLVDRDPERVAAQVRQWLNED